MVEKNYVGGCEGSTQALQQFSERCILRIMLPKKKVIFIESLKI